MSQDPNLVNLAVGTDNGIRMYQANVFQSSIERIKGTQKETANIQFQRVRALEIYQDELYAVGDNSHIFVYRMADGEIERMI